MVTTVVEASVNEITNSLVATTISGRVPLFEVTDDVLGLVLVSTDSFAGLHAPSLLHGPSVVIVKV